MPLPTGQLGCEFLDALKLTERISEKVFAKARELLKQEPDAIPGWSCNETPHRVVSRDTPAVFRTLAKSLEIDALDFLKACSGQPGLAAKTHCPVQLSAWMWSEVEFTLNRTLENLISHELIARLTRSKNRRFPAYLQQLTMESRRLLIRQARKILSLIVLGVTTRSSKFARYDGMTISCRVRLR